ncbi:hypothetical protein TIFTF001_012938 [Ficus carica]|uniref:B3 domain-containing protein n=1 Tax=Ficus carica TaxID=3494 RepID=A0AA88A2M1_FICCA|nr:hypothetical protein TIFTF001_012938 [Ficus carica]
MLAGVCSDVLDGKRALDEPPLPKINHKSVLEALKFAPASLDFPTKRRVTLGRHHCIIKEENVTINNIRPNNDLPVLPPEKRHDRSLKPFEEVKTEVKKKKRTKKSGKRGVIAGPDPAPPMPENLREMVVRDFDVCTVTFVIQKSLFQTDLEKGENRLSMTLKQIASDNFLTEEEKMTLARRRPDKRLEGIEVDFIEPDKHLSKTEMMLKKWDLRSSSSYVLSHNWHNVAERNKLKASDVVQIWFFRSRERKPCIALVNLGRESASSSSSVGKDVQWRTHCLASQAP